MVLTTLFVMKTLIPVIVWNAPTITAQKVVKVSYNNKMSMLGLSHCYWRPHDWLSLSRSLDGELEAFIMWVTSTKRGGIALYGYTSILFMVIDFSLTKMSGEKRIFRVTRLITSLRKEDTVLFFSVFRISSGDNGMTMHYLSCSIVILCTIILHRPTNYLNQIKDSLMSLLITGEGSHSFTCNHAILHKYRIRLIDNP